LHTATGAILSPIARKTLEPRVHRTDESL
jgi:hypothetical protein